MGLDLLKELNHPEEVSCDKEGQYFRSWERGTRT
jgi:hypothetical protein